mmetsp:Transcript_1214/g.2750  ORF Transcript_1214/g.2750 Transcript_1214/m.2750 type:complete len:147 (+) Transcript_1214:3536-3976(+)
MKENKSRKWANISTEKAKMQATIAGIHSQENNNGDRAKKMCVGLMWQDDDFDTIGLDPHCLPLQKKRLQEEQQDFFALGLKIGRIRMLGHKVIRLRSSTSFVNMEVSIGLTLIIKLSTLSIQTRRHFRRRGEQIVYLEFWMVMMMN